MLYRGSDEHHKLVVVEEVAEADVTEDMRVKPPDDPEDYIHRVGRTARGANGSGRALLFIYEHEIGFLRYLKQSKVS